MTYYFLRRDLEELDRQIDTLLARLRDIGKEMGLSCQEGAETFHDNFAYEDGERQQRMWSRHLRELMRVRQSARVVSRQDRRDSATIGCTVVLRDLDSDEVITLTIGSYMTFEQQDVVSYEAPLARLILGSSPGEVLEGNIGGKPRTFEVCELH